MLNFKAGAMRLANNGACPESLAIVKNLISKVVQNAALPGAGAAEGKAIQVTISETAQCAGLGDAQTVDMTSKDGHSECTFRSRYTRGGDGRVMTGYRLIYRPRRLTSGGNKASSDGNLTGRDVSAEMGHSYLDLPVECLQ